MPIALSLMVLMTIALLAGAAYFWRRPGGRKQALLMLVLAAVMAGNVALLTVPGPGGETPVSKAGELEGG